MASSPVTVGILGTGFGTSVQLPAFLALDDAKVIGIASRDAKLSEELAKTHGLPRAFRSWQELITCEDIALVSVASPPFLHEEQVRASIATGKHVLCEKPFTLSADGARKLVNEAERAGIIHAIDFEFRQLRAWQLLKQRLKNIGRVESATFSWVVGTWADPKRPWGWQCDASLGGGVIGALGVHLFDAAEWLLRPMKKLRAKLETRIKERPDERGGMKMVASEDNASIEMRGEDLSASIELSNVDPKGRGLTMEMRGERGILLLESASQDYGRGLRVREGRSDDDLRVVWEDREPSRGDPRIPPFQSFARRLLAAISKRDQTFRPSFAEGLRAQMFWDGAKESQEKGNTWVSIPHS